MKKMFLVSALACMLIVLCSGCGSSSANCSYDVYAGKVVAITNSVGFRGGIESFTVPVVPINCDCKNTIVVLSPEPITKGDTLFVTYGYVKGRN